MKKVRYDDGESTMLAKEDFLAFDYTDYDVPEIEYMKGFDDISLFKDSVMSRARKLGFKGDEKELISFIVGLCKNADIDISRQTITNWFTEGAPSGDMRCRENVYKLCFALNFDEKSTEQFFIKGYLEKPFNYKNINESVYYYCLKKGLKYTDAVRIINQVQNAPVIDNPFPDNDTVMIGSVVESIKNEKDLIRYLSENRDGFKTQNATATDTVLKLIEKNIVIANKEKEKNGEKPDVKSADSLLSVIYGYNVRNKTDYPQSISKSRLPKLVKSNFPQSQQLLNIKSGKGTYDSIRKAILVMEFYNFYGTVYVNESDIESKKLLEEFIDELNGLLFQCGYVQAYWRNPFDWIIGHCASTENPLDEFRSIIQIFYLDDDME